MRRLILGTAGHIDHGKTALVRSLTGVDTDRLAEEKRRGITIDLGFAHLPDFDGVQLGIVDVPGHEGFVRNMLAGATGLDLVLLVVAADEGVMPQTREHLAIVELLGVRGGVVAVTKADVVDAEWLGLVVDDIRDELADTPFANAPVVPVSNVTGAGLDALRERLSAAAKSVGDRNTDDHPRLPIDRVFSVHGTGTVATGTLWSGRIVRESTIRVLPSGVKARVRGVQVHGEAVDAAEAGQRVAIALAGAERDGIGRGDVVVDDAPWTPSRMLTVRLRVLLDSKWQIRPRQRVRFHLGTAEVLGRVALLDRPHLGPGESCWAQLRLESPVIARAGDRFVIRSYSPVTTIGGGIIAEPAPAKRKRLDPAGIDRLTAICEETVSDSVMAIVAGCAWRGVGSAELSIRTPHAPGLIEDALPRLEAAARIVRIGDANFDARLAVQGRARFLSAVDEHHATQPLRSGMDREELRRALPDVAATALREWILARLISDGDLVARGRLIARPDFQPRLSPEQNQVRQRILATLDDAGLAPPTLAELPQELVGRPDFQPILQRLVEDGAVVSLTPSLYVTHTALTAAAHAVRRELGSRKDLAPTDFRTVLPLSRKYLIPLLEYFDRARITVRHGDQRAVLDTH